jgi:hypothetical protein
VQVSHWNPWSGRSMCINKMVKKVKLFPVEGMKFM